ncbi:MAG TPA: cytochrome c oxidase assembly protein [Gaiellaceae bacterium]|nr:cytochrome c oxidase assembly protein [Gaiellaceae bacterium]
MDPYRWSWDADALVIVPALAIAYGMAAVRVKAPRRRVASFGAGCALLLAVLITPLDTLALHYLLSMHLLQNVVLAEWAPLLCLLGLTPRMAGALERLPAARLLTQPFVALPIWLATYFAWHLPWAYDAALRHQWTILHAEHACYFAAGCLLWWPVVHGRRPSGIKAAYIFAAFVLASPLGLLLALLPSPVYDFYEHVPRLWGLSALSDQQIAGVTMVSEQAVVFFAAFAYYLRRFFGEQERSDAFRVPTVPRP